MLVVIILLKLAPSKKKILIIDTFSPFKEGSIDSYHLSWGINFQELHRDAKINILPFGVDSEAIQKFTLKSNNFWPNEYCFAFCPAIISGFREHTPPDKKVKDSRSKGR